MAWKKRKIQEKRDLLAKEEEQKRKDYKSGKQFGFSGREMFSFNPELAQDDLDDDDDAAYASYEREEEDDDDQVYEYKELDLDALAAGAQEVCLAECNLIVGRKKKHVLCSIAKYFRLMVLGL